MKYKELVDTPLSKSTWGCLDMKVPESYDGKKLKLIVTLSGGGKTLSKTKTFTAK
jgi:hypothetical protein